ncbi:MAG: sulfite exporter TauE/SafE family protein, partial [Planctomycetota bacterium]
MDIIFTIIVFVTAAAVQGAAGFGFGLVAVGLLGSLLPIKDASVTLVLASLTLNCFIFYRLRSHFRWDRVLPMIVSTLVGVPLGVWILVAASEVLLHRLLGVVLLVTVVQNFLPGIGDKRWHPVGL